MKDVDVGFFGKLPTHGDFLRRRTTDSFVSSWDAWLQRGLESSRTVLGDRWLDVYLTSPAWRFVCAAGPCGPSAVAGVLVPSVDRAGRCFPLTIVVELPPEVPLLTVAARTTAFFEGAERLLVDTLAAAQIDFSAFDAAVAGLGPRLAPLYDAACLLLSHEAEHVLGDGSRGWQVPIDEGGHLSSSLDQLLSARLASLYAPLVLWWTEGSAMVEPCCRIGAGLPTADAFVGFLDGEWSTPHWRTVSATSVPVSAASCGDDDMAAFSMHSVAVSDVGRVRTVNQDAFVERPALGLWAVADGLGGHRHGEIASREVCDALGDVEATSSLDAMVDAARDRIQAVNAHLLRVSERAGHGDRCGSTVVALMVRGSRCAVVWAGDSRLYRWREGRLECLTRDHSAIEDFPHADRQDAHAITRAVGVAETLQLDERRDDVQEGDRFLLCSDGLTRVVDAADLETWMGRPDLEVVVDGLIGMALDAGAPDNVTALVVAAGDGPAS